MNSIGMNKVGINFGHIYPQEVSNDRLHILMKVDLSLLSIQQLPTENALRV